MSDDFEAQLDGPPVSDDSDGLRSRLPIEIIASQFVDEHRRGLQPSVEDYATRYARLADEIRELFPMLATMERWKGDKETECLRQQVPERFDIPNLGSYDIVREIGRGGMGVVFEGVTEDSEERVAIKMLPWRSSGVPRWRERFEREANTVSQLRHRNIIPVYSFSEHGGYCYYVMRFIDGVSLDWIISRLRQTDGVVFADEIRHAELARESNTTSSLPTGPPPKRKRSTGRRRLKRDSWRMIARIGMHSAEALDYAHRQGILHNDIKPGNLMLDGDGKVWVADFGLAQSMEPDDEKADAERITGTLRYIAPERFAGVTTERSDLYSLGITLYELLTLHAAFDGYEGSDLLERVLGAKLTPMADLRPEIPADLQTIVAGAISLDPVERYESAAEMAMDLRHFANGEPIRSNRRRGWFSRFFK